MKIVYWNIFKLGSTTLKMKLNQGIIANGGLGNNKLDYIVKVVSGDAVWSGATSQVPADVIVILELISGGTAKGAPGTGSCLRVLNAMKAALNSAAPKTHRYDFVQPRLIGNKETVGVLYNNQALTYVNSESMRDGSNKFLPTRTAFWASFTVKSTSRPLNIIGVHGPTSDPKTGDYQEAVAYTNRLADIAQINQAALQPKQDTFIGGDFNCDPTNSYSVRKGQKKLQVGAFSVLQTSCKYSITLPNNTRTSLRNAIDNNQPAPNNYLSQPYDNIVFLLPSRGAGPPPEVKCVDLVGKAPNNLATTNLVAVFNAAWTVSDHLPVVIEF